jgi:type IV pilus assembly protein PilW
MKRKQLGLSLVELLVSLAIGGFLIIGAVTVQSQTRKTFSVNEAQARVQETARFAMSVIEPEAQLAGLLGYSNDVGGAGFIMSAGAEPVYASKLAAGALSGAPAVFDQCGKNFTMDVQVPVYAVNGEWKFPDGCDAGGGGHVAGTDTLTLRFAGVEKAEPKAGRVQVMARRLQTDKTALFMTGAAPYTVTDGMDEVRDYYVKTYYVSPDSDGRPGLPSLRVKQLVSKEGEGTWDDQEVVRGVEDMQIELGVDPGADKNLDGAIDLDPNSGIAIYTNGDVSRYVAPGDTVLTTGQVVAVRLWLRVRAEELEAGFRDRRVYDYSSVDDFVPADGYRRVLISRTIFVRNTRSFPTS